MPDNAQIRTMVKAIYWHAQDGLCGLCGQLMTSHVNRKSVTWDHVWPVSRVGCTETWGNFLLSHRKCNQEKGNRAPTGCELLMLAAVNRRILPAHKTSFWERAK